MEIMIWERRKAYEKDRNDRRYVYLCSRSLERMAEIEKSTGR